LGIGRPGKKSPGIFGRGGREQGDRKPGESKIIITILGVAMTLRTRGKINFRIPTKEGSEEGLVGTAEGIELTTEFKMNKKKR
jgi:hypothetical protein